MRVMLAAYSAVSKNAGVSVETFTRAYDHTESADYILEMTKHDYTGFDQMEAQI